MKPSSPYQFNKRQVAATVEGSQLKYSDITWSRKNRGPLIALCLGSGIFAHQILKMSRWWYLVCFAPAILTSFMDCKFVPYGELENFYKYVYETRKADALFKSYEKEITNQLSKLDQENYLKLKDELLRNNATLYEVGQDLDEHYLTAAIRTDSRQ